MSLLNDAREQLRRGVTPDALAALERRVAAALAETEAICARAGVRPAALPGPSRNAYRYLKALDFRRVPTVTQAPAPAPRVRNLVAGLRRHHQRIWRLAIHQAHGDTTAALAEDIAQDTAAVESICASAGAAPALLPKPSRTAFQLMKFWSQNDHLPSHVETVRRVGSLLRTRHKTASLYVEMSNCSHLWRREQRGGRVRLVLNEMFLYADDAVLAALVEASRARASAAESRLLKEFQAQESATAVLAELSLAAGADPFSEVGAVYHLGEVFERVNADYFRAGMERPRMAWTRSVTYRYFGHYVFATDTVLVSLSLDHPDVPEFVVDYLMFHELLHKRHGVRVANRRRLTHTAAFRRDERRFRRLDEAEAFLKAYSRKLSSRR